MSDVCNLKAGALAFGAIANIIDLEAAGQPKTFSLSGTIFRASSKVNDLCDWAPAAARSERICASVHLSSAVANVDGLNRGSCCTLVS